MGVRETLNSHRGLTVAVAVGVAVLALGVGFWTTFRAGETLSGTKAWYSDDDGKTWFKDDVTKLTPFDHNGKQAVMCFVYTNGKVKWAEYLMRYQPAWKEKAEAMRNNKAANPRDTMSMAVPPMEVKKPGSPDWYPVTSPQGQSMTDPREFKAPDGSKVNVDAFDP